MQSSIKDNYEIEIPNDKAATYKVVTLIIAFINAAAFTYLYFNEPNRSNRDFALLGIILGVCAFVFYLLKSYTTHLHTFKVEIAFLILSGTWFMTGNPWLALSLLLFAFLGFFANRRSLIRFDHNGMSYPSFPPKQIKWEEVNFVILKDGILTIEMKNNRVLQFTLSEDQAEKLDEPVFNNFCDVHTGESPLP